MAKVPSLAGQSAPSQPPHMGLIGSWLLHPLRRSRGATPLPSQSDDVPSPGCPKVAHFIALDPQVLPVRLQKMFAVELESLAMLTRTPQGRRTCRTYRIHVVSLRVPHKP